jgi:hypothetical protein
MAVMCTALLGCADTDTDTDFAKFAKISPPILVLLDPDGEGVDTEPNLVVICMGGKPIPTPDVDTDDFVVPSSDVCESIGLKLELRSADKIITVPETGWMEGVATTAGCRIDFNYSEYRDILSPGTWRIIYRDLPGHDGDGTSASSDIDLDKMVKELVKLDGEQAKYMMFAQSAFFTVPKEYWPSDFQETRKVLTFPLSKKADLEEELDNDKFTIIEMEPYGVLGNPLFSGLAFGTFGDYDPAFDIESMMDNTVDYTGASSDIDFDKELEKISEAETTDKPADDFGTEPVTSGNMDLENEKKPAIAKAGFGMPTAVGLVLVALMLLGAKHRVVQPVLVTSQMVGGIEERGYIAPQSFMMNCENDSEDTYETRREVRLQRRYRAYVEAFQEIGNDPSIREYLLTRLCEEIPRKKELIRKAFEHTAKAA